MSDPSSSTAPSQGGSIAGKRAAVVLNKQAGTIAADPEMVDTGSVARSFEEAGMSPEIILAESTRLGEAVQRALDGGSEVIFVGGGDGSINTAAKYVRSASGILGVLPLGTLNHFAQSLEIPTVIDDAVRALAGGTVGAVDVGEVNGRVFLNNASLGIYPEAVRRRERYMAKHGLKKYIAMGYALSGILWELPLYPLRIEMGGTVEFIKTPFVFLGNNRYEPKFPSYAKRESLTEGCLCLFFARGTTRLGLAKIAMNILLGRIALIPEIETVETIELTIRSRMRRMQVALDGEVLRMRSPLHFRILPKSLKVVLPRKEP